MTLVNLICYYQVQYQAAVVEQLKNRDVEAKGVNISNDKRSRLELSSPLFQMGKVLFHNDRKSAEIIQQIVGFGVEKHDDLVDAVSMGLNYIQGNVQWAVLSEYGGIAFDGEPSGVFHGAFTVRGIEYLDE